VSLINDALNKAREEETASAAPKPANVRAKDAVMSQGKLVGLALCMCGVIIILLSVIIVAILHLFNKSAPVVSETSAPVVSVAASVKPAVAPLPAQAAQTEKPKTTATVVAPQPSEPPAVPAKPVEAVKEPAHPAQSAASPLAVQPPVAKPVEQVPPPQAAPVAAAPELRPTPPAPKIEGADPKIAEFVQSIQIRGVGRSKVLLAIPGREEAAAYAEGDAIDCAYPLTLLSIEPRKLVFVDADGRKYGKTL
jgi:hypothetical protein